MKRVFGVCLILLMLSLTSFAGHPIRGGLLCPGNCVQGVCDVCGDCSSGLQYRPQEDDSTLPVEAMVVLFVLSVIVMRRIRA